MKKIKEREREKEKERKRKRKRGREKEKKQIEVPVAALNKDLPKDWQLVSQTKNVKRYHTGTVTKLMIPLIEAEYTAEV